MQLDPVAAKPVVTRLRRAHGHLGTVIRMLEEGGDREDVLTQLAAVTKALSRAGFVLVSCGLQHCLAQEGELDTAQLGRMEKLFLALA